MKLKDLEWEKMFVVNISDKKKKTTKNTGSAKVKHSKVLEKLYEKRYPND